MPTEAISAARACSGLFISLKAIGSVGVFEIQRFRLRPWPANVTVNNSHCVSGNTAGDCADIGSSRVSSAKSGRFWF